MTTQNTVKLPQQVAAAINEIRRDLIEAGETPRPFRIFEEITSMSDDVVRNWIYEDEAENLQRLIREVIYG